MWDHFWPYLSLLAPTSHIVAMWDPGMWDVNVRMWDASVLSIGIGCDNGWIDPTILDDSLHHATTLTPDGALPVFLWRKWSHIVAMWDPWMWDVNVRRERSVNWDWLWQWMDRSNDPGRLPSPCDNFDAWWCPACISVAKIVSHKNRSVNWDWLWQWMAVTMDGLIQRSWTTPCTMRELWRLMVPCLYFCGKNSLT